MIKSKSYKTLMMVLFLAPSFLMAQHIVWERSLATDSNERSPYLTGIVGADDGSIIGVGSVAREVYYGVGGFKTQPRILKFDSMGQLIWIKGQVADTLSEGGNSFIKKVPNENGSFYVGSIAKQATSSSSGIVEDIVMKIDTAADTIWTARFNYFTAFRNTLAAAVVLKDKSIVTAGYNYYVGTDFDVLYRRIDSLGNLLWEETYSLASDQFGFDITEMMDGSLIIAGKTGDDNLLLRVGFDGGFIESNVFTGSNSTSSRKYSNVLPNNALLFYNDFWTGLWYESQFVLFDDSLNVLSSNFGRDILRTKASVLQSSNLLLPRVPDWDSMLISNVSLNYALNSNLLISYAEPRVAVLAQMISGNDLILAGVSTNNNESDYWIAKIDGVGEEWIPDPCTYSPPVAGFAYDLNGGILTLQDTSYAGLKYLDTIYTWQWTFGNGMVDTTESPITLWDTISAPTLDVELIVSNWYGCTDTLQTTLIANPVGTGIIAMNQFTEKVWPNPARDVLNVSLSEKPGQIVQFEIFDVHGRKQLQTSFSGKEGNLNISTLASGIYFYKISSGGVVKRGKVVKG